MGVGVLLIFIATILTAAIAAGVLVRTSGVIGVKAVEVEKVARERLTTGMEFVKITGYSNTTAGTIENIEIMGRLKAGSSPVDLQEMFITFVEGSNVFTAELEYNSSSNETCSFDNVTAETSYCFEPLFGNTNPQVEEEELIYIRYKLNESHKLESNDNFELQLIPKVGEISIINVRVPSIKTYAVQIY